MESGRIIKIILQFMNTEAETKQSLQKPHRRKLFRNIWLFSILLVVVLFIVHVAVSMNNYNELMANIFLLSASIAIPIGIISFLIWIFVPSSKNIPKFSRVLDIVLGIALASQFALTIYCITYIYFYNIGLGDSLYNLLFTLLAFSLVCFAWIKIRVKKILFKSIIVLVLIGAYFFGRVYAVQTYQTYKDAQNLLTQANSNEGAYMRETDMNKYLEGQRKYTASLKVVAETPSKALRWGRKYYEDLYILQKEALDHNEKLATGEIVLTKEENDKLLKEYGDRVNNAVNLEFPLPFWTDYFMVKQ